MNLKKLIVFILISSCVPFNKALLIPTDRTVNPRLPRLINSEDSKISVTWQSGKKPSLIKIETLYQNELDESILTKSGDFRGYLDTKIEGNAQVTGQGFAMFTGFTFGVLNVLGMPYSSYTIDIDTRVRILNLKGQEIWRKTYSENKKIYIGFYYGANIQNETLKLFRIILSDLKSDLQKNNNFIQNQL